MLVDLQSSVSVKQRYAGVLNTIKHVGFHHRIMYHIFKNNPLSHL